VSSTFSELPKVDEKLENLKNFRPGESRNKYFLFFRFQLNRETKEKLYRRRNRIAHFA
jgi:hypothetical protein